MKPLGLRPTNCVQYLVEFHINKFLKAKNRVKCFENHQITPKFHRLSRGRPQDKRSDPCGIIQTLPPL